MSREFPDYIDPWKAADGRRRFQGTMPIKRMKRLMPLLELDSPAAADDLETVFQIAFRRDRQGLVIVDVATRTILPLLCQRSLVPYGETVDRNSRLAVITELSEADELPDSYDPLLVEDGRIAMIDVVEDELLLAVPQVPRNPEVAAVEMSTGGEDKPPPVEEERTHRPFAGLAGLMKDSSGD